MTEDYIATVRLLLGIAPTVFRSGQFAMKGGTALNLFVQDMPRLSVDIDVVFIDHRPDRETALTAIAAELRGIQQALQGRWLGAKLARQAKRRRGLPARWVRSLATVVATNKSTA